MFVLSLSGTFEVVLFVNRVFRHRMVEVGQLCEQSAHHNYCRLVRF